MILLKKQEASKPLRTKESFACWSTCCLTTSNELNVFVVVVHFQPRQGLKGEPRKKTPLVDCDPEKSKGLE